MEYAPMLEKLTGLANRPERPFCCQGFKNLIATAGQAGFSAVVVEGQGMFKFELQSRAVSKDEEDRLSRHPAPLPLQENLKTSCSIALNFCPSCGRKLRSLVTATWKSFEAMAAEHGRFLIARY